MNIPKMMILFRVILVPIFLILTYFLGQSAAPILLILMYLGLISDILDGVIARKNNISTAALRRMDSQADMLFWLSLGICTYWLYPELIRENRNSVIAILAMEAACYLISIFRFGKETCTHAFLSKMWGLSLLAAFTALLGFNHAGVPFAIAIGLGLISHIDRILITILLPVWEHDIPSAYHAWMRRKGKSFKKHDLLNG